MICRFLGEYVLWQWAKRLLGPRMGKAGFTFTILHLLSTILNIQSVTDSIASYMYGGQSLRMSLSSDNVKSR